PQRWVGTEVTGQKKCERRDCPCGIEAGLRFGDAARGAPRQARESDRRVRVPPPLPPLPAPLRPQKEDEEALSGQSISDQGSSQIRVVKAGLSPQKANLDEMCGPILSDSFHLAEYQAARCGQKLHAANLHHQKQHTGDKPLRSDVRRALFVNSCKFYVSRKPFTFGDVGKDFLGNSGFLHQQATRTWEKSNSGTE
ncbi:hypothetical protein E2I00_002887, partial [Balaenoptera physalus]